MRHGLLPAALPHLDQFDPAVQQRIDGTPLSRLHDQPPHFGTKYAEDLLEREELAAVKSIIDAVKRVPKPRLDLSPVTHLKEQGTAVVNDHRLS